MKFPFLQIPIPGMPADSVPTPSQELSTLKNMSFDDLMNRLVNDLVEFTIHLAIALVVFYVGKFVIKKIFQITATVLHRREVDKSLTTFVLSLIKIVLYFILIVTVIGILGINTSSFLAIFASVGVAIGMALSGTLQNFAGGVLILLLKPYRVGDYIEAQGFGGKVVEIQIFSTLICTGDNKTILLPNGALSTGSINNWSRQNYRRVEWSVGISYGDDFNTARDAIVGILTSNPLVLKPGVEAADKAKAEEQKAAEAEATAEAKAMQPAAGESSGRRDGWFRRILNKNRERQKERQALREAALSALESQPVTPPAVYISELADSSVNLTVRAWVRTDDYWSVYFDVMERIYTELPGYGVSFPFPQMDVHLVNPS